MKVALVGTGNLGSHLAFAISNTQHTLIQVYGRTPDRVAPIVNSTGAEPVSHFNQLRDDLDIVILAISDSAIESAAQEIAAVSDKYLIVHTAGSMSSKILSLFDAHGVFYPLQTFTIGREIEWSAIPILLTASNDKVMDTLQDLAGAISKNVRQVTDKERLVLHLCATIANNFSNHMFQIAEELAVANQLDFSLLKPLILETALKVENISPGDAQTGAAIRHDDVTIEKHKALLAKSPDILKLYELLTTSIQDNKRP